MSTLQWITSITCEWRIKSQILFIQLITFTVVIVLLGCVVYVQFNSTFAIISEDSQSILINKQMKRYVNTTMGQYKRFTERSFKQFSKVLSTQSMLYEMINLHDFSFKLHAEQSLNEDNYEQNLIQYQNTYTYGIFGDPTPQTKYLDMMALTNILTEIKLVLETTNLYFISTSDEQYYSIWPGDPYGSYRPHSRPWYINHLATMNQTDLVYSKPYASFFGGVYVTQTQNLTNELGVLRGVAAIDINVTQFQEVSQWLKFVDMSVINHTGQYVVTKFYPTNHKQVENIYNELLTGFNKLNFEQIYNFTFGLPYNNSCEVLLDNTLCLVDQNKEEQIITTSKLNNPPYIVILKTQSQFYNQELELLLDSINEEIKQTMYFMLYLTFGSIGACLLIYFICIVIIQRPIDRLMSTTLAYVRNQHQKIHLITSLTAGDSINKLNLAFFNIMKFQSTNRTQLNETQKHFYNIQYPQCYIKIRHQITQYLQKITRSRPDSQRNKQKQQLIFKNELHKKALQIKQIKG